MKTYVVDIDGTICTNTYGEYKDAKPLDFRINFFNNLFESGHIVNYFTARGSTTSIDWREVTEMQLKEWGVKYNELIMGKPHGDVFIDDKAYNVINWDWCTDNIMEAKSSVDSLLEIDSYLINTCNSFECLLHNGDLKKKINNIGLEMQKTLSKGGKIIFAGNGGSFGDAQHLSAELVSKLNKNRNPLSSVALGTNSSAFSAIANDYGYENTFSREFAGIVNKNDLLIAISTSGNSLNIINLVKKSLEESVSFYILTGESGGECKQFDERLIRVPSKNTAIVQQMHITIGHILCSIAEKPFI